MATGLFNLKQVNQAISQGAWSGYIAPRWVEYLVVAGGGGGGGFYGGGGGAGGLLTGIVTVAAGASYTVTIGTGGAGATSGSARGSSGVNSVFGSISTTGGGAGGADGVTALSGGSGGGAITPQNIGTGTSGQGNAGGSGFNGSSTTSTGGGGGGAGTVGITSNTSSVAGNGGAGIASSITGTVVTYAGGGGGGTGGSLAGGAGGVGGGGTGGTARTAGSDNTGGGGGGACNSTQNTGGNGGSGIVVVRYPGNVQFFTGGTVTYSNGYIVHNFTANGTLAPTTPTVVSEYQISRSLRFNSADSAYVARTFPSAGNRKTWTWSAWIKRSALDVTQQVFSSRPTASPYALIYFQSTGKFIYSETGLDVQTTQVFRDASAWYHLVIAIDTTQATSSDRVKFYVNGVQITAFSTATYPSQSYDTQINTASQHNLSGAQPYGAEYFSGYMTEVNFIDGQALTPTSFGYVNPTTGIWSPAKFVGSYGTNGFYLNFSDNSNTTAATLGKDYSGNGNNWTPNNFSVTAGVGNDSLVDSPTSYGTDTGVGGTVRGNYATLNPLVVFGTSAFTNGNLDVSVSSLNTNILATIAIPTSGKWYWEYQITSVGGGGSPMGGIASTSSNSPAIFYRSNGDKLVDGTSSSYGATYTTTDIIGVAVDTDGGTITFYKNGSSQGAVTYATSSGSFFPALRSNAATDNFTVNFGQRAFANTAPSGFKALCTQNLPTPTIGATTATQAGKYFNPVLYTGNGGTQSVTGVGFQPDWTWIKSRSTAGYSHRLVDAVRGVTKEIYSNLTNAEGTDSNGLTAFGSDGFTLGSSNEYNNSGGSFVAWNWKANGSGSTNTAGSITSTVSASTTSGFSVVTYTGNATSNQTFGHGLGAKVDFAIIKSRSAVSSPAWMVWHRSVCSGNGKALALEETNAIQGPFGTPIWDSSNTSTQSSTTTFTIGANTTINASGATYVAYCFAEVAGYSKFGSYTGNGSTDGTFVYLGFRPAYIMIKSTDANGWIVMDSKRNTYNIANTILQPNTSGADSTDSTNYAVDFLSNGFKLRNSASYFNGSGVTLIYAAFAESPFKTSLAR